MKLIGMRVFNNDLLSIAYSYLSHKDRNVRDMAIYVSSSLVDKEKGIKMGKLSKMIAGGLGASVAKLASGFLTPFVGEDSREALEYTLYTIITGLSVYMAPANK